MAKRTMANVSYGLSKPGDLAEKLRRDAAKLTSDPNPDDVFNFFVTAAALDEWVRTVFTSSPIVDGITFALKETRTWEDLPVEVGAWIRDVDCLPNRHCDVRRHIFNTLRICWSGAGASKHFHWERGVKEIAPEPIVGDWYQYFFTSTAPDLYIDYEGEVYGLSQVRDVVLQFYDGLLAAIRKDGQGHDV